MLAAASALALTLTAVPGFAQATDADPDKDQIVVTGQAAIGDYGLDLTTRDLSVRPGDDFERYASGAWIDRTEIPSDRPSVGSFYNLHEEVQENVQKLIQEAPAGTKYGALYADPLPIGGAGIPPTLLMQDMRHFLPDYLTEFYLAHGRGLDDVRVKICQSFQKSMFCVTSASLQGLLPYSADTANPQEQAANRAFLADWMDRLMTSRLAIVQL